MSTRARNLWLLLFGAAFGVLEGAVVVYLRELYYPQGFHFPIVIIPDRVAIIELTRELATLLMLAGVAMAAGRDRMDRFFIFAFLFGVWDIIYYVALWVFLAWPPSLMTWDVLFLIPVPWLGPVIYPVIVSVALIAGFLVHERMHARGAVLRMTAIEWSVAIVGAVAIIVAFCWNWRAVAQGIVPADFPTTLFTIGLTAGVIPFVRAGSRGSRRS